MKTILTTKTSNASEPPDLASRPCPACGSRRGRALGTDRAGSSWRRCDSCGTSFVPHIPEDNQLRQLYDQQHGRGPAVAPPSSIRRSLTATVASLEGYRLTNRFLDVGYGAGLLLEVAEAAGWEVWGTEISQAARARTSWNVRYDELPDADLPRDFDVVVFVEVLEHLPDPERYVRAACERLRPGGVLFGTTPNGRGISARVLGTDWSAYDAPEHLHLFSPSGLGHLLRQAAFVTLVTSFSGVNPYELVRSRSRQEPFDRVGTSYELNERLESSASGAIVKGVGNAVLNATRLGDSMRFRAERQA